MPAVVVVVRDLLFELDLEVDTLLELELVLLLELEEVLVLEVDEELDLELEDELLLVLLCSVLFSERLSFLLF